MNKVTRYIAVCFLCAAPIVNADDTPPVAPDQDAIAVLPIEVLTDDPKGAELAAQAHTQLLDSLNRLDGVSVVDPGRVETFRGSDLPTSEIAAELGVNRIVKGELQLWPPYYVLQLQLRDSEDSRSRGGTHALIGVTDPTIKCAINPETALPDGIAETVTSIDLWMHPIEQPTAEQMRATARATVFNKYASDQKRLKSIRQLKQPFFVDGVNRPQYSGEAEDLSGAVAVVAVELGLKSADEGVRHGAWRVMAGVGDLYLVGPLMQSLQNDDDVWVRAQAAMTLVDFVAEPGVREALDYARTNDSEHMVRRAATISYLGPEELLAYHREVVLDPSEKDWDRWESLGKMRPQRGRNPEPYADDVVVAAIVLAQNSKDPRVRQGVWFNLSQTNTPKVVTAIIDALTDDPSERVREALVMALGHNLAAENGVREAIELANANDPSPLVRKQATDSLKRMDMKAKEMAKIDQ